MVKLFFICFLIAPLSFAQLTGLDKPDRVKAYLIQNGQDPELVYDMFIIPGVDENIYLNRWIPQNLAEPSEQDLLSSEEAAQVVSAYYENKAAEDFAVRQASKPLEQRQYENQFYALIEQLFNLTGVTNEVTPKLGFPGLQAKIEQVQATDPMLAINLSLKLLSIDSALKRYDTLWWDDAIQHEIPEE